MKKEIVIGSRKSKLAVIQSELAINYLKETHPELGVRLVTMKTTGDKILDRNLDKIGGKGLFVKELEAALREKRCDFSIHSLKDVPMELPGDLPIVCFSRREDPRDVLVLPEGKTEIDFSKPIGTSSARRTVQFKRLYKDASCESIRGNVQTRLRKLDEGEYGAIVLAAAGLKRLGLEHRISRYFTIDEMMPAAGQGILAVQGRTGEDTSIWESFQEPEATAIALAERAFVRRLDGGCSSPIAAHAYVSDGRLFLKGLYIKEEEHGDRMEILPEDIRIETISGELADAEKIGEELAGRMKATKG